MKRLFARLINLAPWVGAALILTVLYGTIYTVTQQSIRLAANEQPAQVAEDTAAALDQGALPQSLLRPPVDVSASLAPFLIIYDAQGTVVGSSAQLNGQTPTLPSDVFSVVSARHEVRFTWQPQNQPKVRLATVVVKANQYYVLSGRSMREVELREDHTRNLTALGWVLSELMLAASLLLSRRRR